ncbi:FHA domain-containing protein [Solimonas sp. K1W22B-7]|uniref:cytochrome c3 family protein n=1 Tax=Solimonas sp. K1W22B-7 TaxID=2303331 RepID=UPI000E337D98|nr:cytochrome c3 family protein [Solimonas sp. K1W22B-7]AXQ30996.1 FHA domain-containing protein [Solimonas sp. K1W22B-7]
MRVLLRSFQQQGDQRIATERGLIGERLTIGRGTNQDVYTPDLRAALAHAEIVHDRRGPLLMSKTANGVWVNGSPVENAKLEKGDVIEIGRFRLEVLAVGGVPELVLGYEERLTQAADIQQRKASYQTRLDQTGLSLRRLAWGLMVLMLLVGLLLPLGLRYGSSHAGDSPRERAAGQRANPLDDSIWLSGPVSSAHRYFVEDCAACHEKPFRQVRDSACMACHKDMKQHSDDTAMLSHPVFAGQECTDCHREHNGTQGINAQSLTLCTDCHADPDKEFASARLPPASSFSKAHPEFAPRVAVFDAKGGRFMFTKQREAPAQLREATNLVYPHDVHLNPKGIDSPEGKVVMKCADCHQPDSRGVSFEPVNMEKHCASCHRLDFDPDDPARELPHGRPEQIQGVVRDYYYAKALQGGVGVGKAPAVVRERRRPGETLPPGGARAALDWADARAHQTMVDVFERRTCHYCHQVQRSDDPAMPWTVAPVNLQEHALDGARFDHAAHKAQDCGDCHAADKSKISAEVLLPDLNSCRDCHGDTGSTSQVPSDCTLCHRFHIAETHHFGGMPATKLPATHPAVPPKAPAAVPAKPEPAKPAPAQGKKP